MEPNEMLPLNVKIAMIVDHVLGEMLVDTLDIYSETGHIPVLLKVDSDLVTGIADPLAIAPDVIESISPNPFRKETRIAFHLENSEKVTMAVYTISGQMIRTLVSGNLPGGDHEIAWDGKDDRGSQVSAGIYVLKMESGNNVDIRKLILSQ
jgi:hypothetical protein